MLNLKMAVVLPYRICADQLFVLLLNDFIKAGIKHFVITIDCDFYEPIYLHKQKIKSVQNSLEDLFKLKKAKFKVVSNFIFLDSLYSAKTIRKMKRKSNDYFFFTLPQNGSTDIAMKNLFILKNLGYYPVIMSFDKVLMSYPKRFCELISEIENLSFVYNTYALQNETNLRFIYKSVSVGNTVLFSTTNLRSEAIKNYLTPFITYMKKIHKTPLSQSSGLFIKRFFGRSQSRKP